MNQRRTTRIGATLIAQKTHRTKLILVFFFKIVIWYIFCIKIKKHSLYWDLKPLATCRFGKFYKGYHEKKLDLSFSIQVRFLV